MGRCLYDYICGWTERMMDSQENLWEQQPIPEVPDRPVTYVSVIEVRRSKPSPCTWLKTVHQERRPQQSCIPGGCDCDLEWPGGYREEHRN